MRTPKEWAEQEWSRDEYHFGDSFVWLQLVDFIRDVQNEAVVAERERCAKVAEAYLQNKYEAAHVVTLRMHGESRAVAAIAAKIRREVT